MCLLDFLSTRVILGNRKAALNAKDVPRFHAAYNFL
jgi:hypothetical protein